jgi:hypothetical protein
MEQMANTDRTRSEIEFSFAKQIYQMRKDEQKLADKKQADAVQDIKDQTALLGLEGASLEIEKQRQKWMKEHPEGARGMEDALKPLEDATKENVFGKTVQSIKDDMHKLDLEILKFGKDKEEAYALDIIEKFRAAQIELTPEVMKTRDNLIKMGQAQIKLKTLLEGPQASQKFDAAAYGSVEGLSRVQAQRDQGNQLQVQYAQEQVKLLEMIRDKLPDPTQSAGVSLHQANLKYLYES